MAKPKSYASLLHMAVTMRNVGWVKRLLEEGYNPNIKTTNYRPLLHTALLNDDAEIAILLKEAGASDDAFVAIETRTDTTIVELNGNTIEWRTIDRSHISA